MLFRSAVVEQQEAAAALRLQRCQLNTGVLRLRRICPVTHTSPATAAAQGKMAAAGTNPARHIRFLPSARLTDRTSRTAARRTAMAVRRTCIRQAINVAIFCSQLRHSRMAVRCLRRSAPVLLRLLMVDTGIEYPMHGEWTSCYIFRTSSVLVLAFALSIYTSFLLSYIRSVLKMKICLAIHTCVLYVIDLLIRWLVCAFDIRVLFLL